MLGRGGPRPSASLYVDPGTTIVLYTDGLVERRGEPLDVGLSRLVEAVRGLTGQEDRARQLVEAIGSQYGIDDDVAVLVVSFAGQMRVRQSSSNSLAPVISMSRATMLDVADTRRSPPASAAASRAVSRTRRPVESM